MSGGIILVVGALCMATDLYLTCTGSRPRRASTVSLCSVSAPSAEATVVAAAVEWIH